MSLVPVAITTHAAAHHQSPSPLASFIHPHTLQTLRAWIDPATGQPWFAAMDICRALSIPQHRVAVSMVEDEDKRTILLEDARGGDYHTIGLTEAGLYALVMRSPALTEARQFREWVKGEVMPQIQRSQTTTAAAMTILEPEMVEEATEPADSGGGNIFEHPTFGRLRTHTDPGTGQPWFVARDVAEALGYRDTKDAVRTHCKHAKLLKGGETPPLTTSRYGINIIPEPDVYRLIIRSKLPAAQQFEAWVMEVVLPQIRQTGGYIPVHEQNESDQDLLARAMLVAGRTIEQKEAIIQRQEATLQRQQTRLAGQQSVIDAQAANLAVMHPKAQVYDSHVAQANSMTLARYARTLYGVNTLKIKEDLLRHDYLYQHTNRTYRVYATYRDTLFAEKLNPTTGKLDIYVLEKGKQAVSALYLKGALTMKTGCTVKGGRRAAY